jgi:hypothetical protein
VKKREKLEPGARKAQYQPTDLEKGHRRQAGTPAPHASVPNDGSAAAAPRYHPSERLDVERLTEAVSRYDPDGGLDTFNIEHLIDVFRTEDRDFIGGLSQQLIHAGSRLLGDALSFMFAVIKGIEPRDQLEAMLAAQMAGVHVIMMKYMAILAKAEDVLEQENAERTINKLARTFTNQLEALKRYRTGGEQKVTVQHVSVGEGGQAIVGHVTQAARGSPAEIPAQATAALTDARQPAMPIIEKPEHSPVPVRRRRNNDGESSA